MLNYAKLCENFWQKKNKSSSKEKVSRSIFAFCEQWKKNKKDENFDRKGNFFFSFLFHHLNKNWMNRNNEYLTSICLKVYNSLRFVQRV